MNPHVRVEALRPDLVDAVAELIDRFGPDWSLQRGGAAYCSTEWSQRPPLGAYIDVEDRSGVVGLYGDYPAACGLFRASGSRCSVDMVAVDPEFRGVGLGEAVMVAGLEAADRWGCTEIDAHALPGDRHTKNFFESFGLKARLLVVSARIDDIERPVE